MDSSSQDIGPLISDDTSPIVWISNDFSFTELVDGNNVFNSDNIYGYVANVPFDIKLGYIIGYPIGFILIVLIYGIIGQTTGLNLRCLNDKVTFVSRAT